jgi:hypothetical protein
MTKGWLTACFVALIIALGQASTVAGAIAQVSGTRNLASAKQDLPSPFANEIAVYGMLCLVALNRQDELQKTIVGIVTANPFYQLAENQASPRVRTLFRNVRRTLLPSIAQRAYADARSGFDRTDGRAAAKFDLVLALLDDPDIKDEPGSADMRMRARGFRELSARISQATFCSPILQILSRRCTSATRKGIKISPSIPPARLNCASSTPQRRLRLGRCFSSSVTDWVYNTLTISSGGTGSYRGW